VTDIDLSDLAADGGGSRKLRGYLARPAGTAPWPALVMIHEIFGLDDVMRRHADHLAGLGYLTLAVDLFSAGGTTRCLVATMTAMSRGHGRAFADIGAARDYLDTSSDCTGKIGVIGFCMGGGFALLSASDGYDAAAVNYGQLPSDLDETLSGACPIVGSYGRSNPRRQGIPRGRPRLPQRHHQSRSPRATSLAAGRRHRSRARVSQRRVGPDRTILRHPPQLTVFALTR
jgi:carboxymethylenebutenolidase